MTQMEDIQKEMEEIKEMVKKRLEEKPIPKLDANGDGKVTAKEAFDWAKMIAREYVWLFFALVMTIISFYKPTSLDDWRTVLMLSLSMSAVIYGGYLKRNFQKQYFEKDKIQHELEAENMANKEALSKATSENERLKHELITKDSEIDFWRSLYEKAEKKIESLEKILLEKK